ncbi:hypothetical protein HY389_00920 [Candidatus Daviesbacteria bacterium]|nr:hypothetical protein [Candidatus Daviesbacteria bacterium]
MEKDKEKRFQQDLEDLSGELNRLNNQQNNFGPGRLSHVSSEKKGFVAGIIAGMRYALGEDETTVPGFVDHFNRNAEIYSSLVNTPENPNESERGI